VKRAERRALSRQLAKTAMAVATPQKGQIAPQGGGQMALPMMSGQMVQAKTTIYPFAEDLEAYNRAIPNGGERLFNNFENQSTHRQALENRVVDSNIRQAERGQFIGLFLGVSGMAAGLIAALQGHDIFAGTIVTVVLAGGFGVFITGRKQQQNDLQQKRAAAEKSGAA